MMLHPETPNSNQPWVYPQELGIMPKMTPMDCLEATSSRTSSSVNVGKTIINYPFENGLYYLFYYGNLRDCLFMFLPTLMAIVIEKIRTWSEKHWETSYDLGLRYSGIILSDTYTFRGWNVAGGKKNQLNGGLNGRIIELNGRVIFQRATFDYRIVAKIKSFWIFIDELK